MLLVIFGAGASYDSSATYPPNTAGPFNIHRLPLANQLFDNRPDFVNYLTRYPQVKPVVNRLRGAGVGGAIERELSVILDEGKTNKNRIRQLAAVRYYLQDMIRSCEARWSGVTSGITNHITLIDEIDQWMPNEPVCFVTFNYDTILENALSDFGMKFGSIQSYIENPRFKVFKVHGSVNWGREVVVQCNKGVGFDQIPKFVIEQAPDLFITEGYSVSDSAPIGSETPYPLYPAIAVPVQGKSKFEFPEAHFVELKKCLPKVRKILIVGWRGTESHFLNLLDTHLTQPTIDYVMQHMPVTLVSGEPKQSDEPISNLKTVGRINFKYSIAKAGFSQFITSQEMRDFLRN